MHPILFTVFGFPIYTYGVFMALSIMLGLPWAAKRAEAQGLSGDDTLQASIIMVLCGLLGARLFYLLYFPVLWSDPLRALTERGGLVWYGGLCGGIVAGLIYIGLKKIPLRRFADVMILPAALGLAIGRIGCLMTGCCYGRECHLPWAIQFPAPHETYPLWLHPTQLYESLGVCLLLLSLLWLERKPFFKPGLSFSGFLIAYGVLRFVVEMYRADALAVGCFSSSQWMSLAAFGVGLLLLVRWQFRATMLTPPA